MNSYDIHPTTTTHRARDVAGRRLISAAVGFVLLYVSTDLVVPNPTLFFPPAVSLTALTVATVLAVAKPWGRIRPRQRTGGRP